MAPLPLLAGLAALIPFTVPGFAPPPGADQIPSSTLVLATTQDGEVTRTANLYCEPAGGTHPQAQVACDELAHSDGHVEAVEDLPDVACTFEYRPVRVTAIGTWRGEERSFDHTFPNACAMRVDTGTVFQF